MKKLFDWHNEYVNTEEHNKLIVDNFRELTNSIEDLKKHRDFIDDQQKMGILYGHGDRSLQYLWKLIVDEMPRNFNFLEIGVYKGQILSLIELLSKKANKTPKIYGVTPLYDPDFATYDRLPYIKTMYSTFGLSMDNTTIFDGLSQDQKIIDEVKKQAPFDIVYVDGDHSYNATALDIQNFGKMLKVGGYMVVDDCNNFKNIPDEIFKGIFEVSMAVKDNLENHPGYIEVLTCMHVRVWKKINDLEKVTSENFWE